jgi:acyl transferase domain-containing protein
MSLNRQETPQDGPEPLAIVGVGCWLPGDITSLEDLLAALREGRDLITEIPAERWNVDAFYDPDPLAPGKTYVRKGGFVTDIDRFDAGFFGISDAEASRMDPQQRMVLQTVWHALENAGQAAEELEHSDTGVFLAMMNTNGYSQIKGGYEGMLGLTAYDAMGDAMSITAGRVSHFFGLEGPALTLDTACSSSLVALHLARQSILSGESTTAIVAGVNAILHPGIHIAFSKVGLMSREGRCAAFDAAADGYIRGEGCMAVVLRRQSEAIARGDRILASIVGTAVNQDGHTPAVTAPNGRAQEKVIRSALARVGVRPSEIGYLEAHGTGTPVGDPIEMSAIANVYGPGRTPDEKLYVGSVKSNFGHIEAGAGLLGLVKAALSLQHGEIYPSLHFKQWNPNIDLGQAPVEVPTGLVAWPRGSGPRMAGVNSFGYSGTNAHAILQETSTDTNGRAHAEQGATARERPNELLVLSAKSKASLEELVDKWLAYLEKEDSASWHDIAFTAAIGRARLSHRLAAVVSSKAEMVGKLRTWREGRNAKGLAAGQTRLRLRPRVAFMFTGQGAQYAGMGAELYKTEARFAETLDRVAAIMDGELGVPLKDVLFGPEARNYLSNTRFVQPALFAVEYALASLLRHWGVEPDFVIGHSIGEITAACFAEVLDLEDAIRFVVARGRLMGELPEGGKMLAIGADLEQARQWIKGREADVSIATVNGPQAVVVSGKAEAVEAVAELAQEAGLRTTPLEVSHAFHSPLMDPILDELAQVAASMRIAPARIPIVSNVTGDFHGDTIEPGYWSNHVRQAVLFHAGMEKIVEAGATLLVEIGPNPALTPAVATSFDAAKVQPVPTLKRDGKDVTNMLGALAMLFVKGTPMNLERLFWSPHYRRVSLPLYPFRKERHWAAPVGALDRHPQAPAEKLPDLPALHPLLGEVVMRSARRTVFQMTLSTTSPWTDHRVLGATVFPGTAYLDMAARGFAALSGQGWRPAVLKDVSFERPLFLVYRKPKTIRLIFEQGLNGGGEAHFRVAAADNEAEVYCQGRISPADGAVENVALATVLPERNADMQIGPFYGELRQGGLEYGAQFSNARELWFGEDGSGRAVGRVAFARFGDNAPSGPFDNAVLLDGCLHVFGAAFKRLAVDGHQGAYVPASIQSVTLRREFPPQVWSQVTLTTKPDARAALADILVLNDGGEVLAQFSALELRHTDGLAAGKSVARPAGASTAAFIGLAAKTRAELIEYLRPMSKPQRVRELSKWLTSEIKDTMGQAAEGLDLDSLPPNTAFLEIGLDSLLVTELQRRIQEKLEFRFKPMQGLDYQSIDSMAEYLHDEVLAGDLRGEPAASPA